MPVSESRSLIVPVTIAAGTVIFCTLVLSQTLIGLKSTRGMIRVTGSARRQVRADYIIWDGKIKEQSPTQAQAYRALEADVRKVTSYLAAQGLRSNEIISLAVRTQPLYAGPAGNEVYGAPDRQVLQKIVAYELTEDVEVRSGRVDLVERISHSATDLIRTGLPFTSNAPQYVYQNMGALKLDLLGEAGRNARERAVRIAGASGGHVGDVRYARMGVVQVTPAFADNPVSDQGTEDTTSLDKNVTAVVSVGYSLR